MTTTREYVLGTGADELARLGLQHRLWADAAHGAWLRAQLRIGQRILDVGCGPGYATFDLAQLVGPGGRVVGIDESAAFVAHVEAQARARALTQVETRVGDVQRLADVLGPAHAGGFDGAYARWVLCFVPDPASVVAGVHGALRRGGRFIVHDYFNYGSMSMAPRRVSHDRAVAATIASWRARGGDPDIVGRLPRLLAAAGFELLHLAVHQRLARPGDTMWHWPDVWWRTYAPKLVESGFLAREDMEQLFRDLDDIAARNTDFIQPPPVFEVIAEKR